MAKDKQLKTFTHCFMGKCVIDTKEKNIYLFSKKQNSYICLSFAVFDEVAQSYKGCSTLYKPYNVLCYEHQVKHNRHGLMPEDTDREGFFNYLKGLERVEPDEE